MSNEVLRNFFSKKMLFFHIGAQSLLLVGCLLVSNFSNVLLEITLVFLGINIIYRDNVSLRYSSKKSILSQFIYFFELKVNWVVVSLTFFLIIFSVFYLSFQSFLIFSIIGFLGFIYSLNAKGILLKSYPFVKNILIGIAWALLIFIPSLDFYDKNLTIYFITFFFQVFIGSVIRDIPDINLDVLNNIKTIPILIGSNKTFILLHFLNIFCLLSFYCIEIKYFFPLLMMILWRGITLVGLSKNRNSFLWSHVLNLMTCFMPLLVLLIR